MHLLYLAIAIVCEVVATSSLKASASFTKPGPTAIVIIGYAAAFYFLSLCLNKMHVAVAYAIWSAMGMVLLTVVGVVLYKQIPDAWGLLGIGLIIAGVLLLKLVSLTGTA